MGRAADLITTQADYGVQVFTGNGMALSLPAGDSFCEWRASVVAGLPIITVMESGILLS